MKKLLFLLFFIPLVSFGQTKDEIELCASLQANSFTTDKEAENALNRILSIIGASSKNFVLAPCDKIVNAVATSYKGTRYIFYDKDFMKLINQNTNDWSNLLILAHEVGHHIRGHSIDILLYSNDVVDKPTLPKRREMELEADEFAGFILAKLGANYNQISEPIKLIAPNKKDIYSTHPSKSERLEALRIGFNKARATEPEEKSPPVTITRISEKDEYNVKSSAWTYDLTYELDGKFEWFKDDRNKYYIEDKVIPMTLRANMFTGAILEPKTYFKKIIDYDTIPSGNKLEWDKNDRSTYSIENNLKDSFKGHWGDINKNGKLDIAVKGKDGRWKDRSYDGDGDGFPDFLTKLTKKEEFKTEYLKNLEVVNEYNYVSDYIKGSRFDIDKDGKLSPFELEDLRESIPEKNKISTIMGKSNLDVASKHIKLVIEQQYWHYPLRYANGKDGGLYPYSGSGFLSEQERNLYKMKPHYDLEISLLNFEEQPDCLWYDPPGEGEKKCQKRLWGIFKYFVDDKISGEFIVRFTGKMSAKVYNRFKDFHNLITPYHNITFTDTDFWSREIYESSLRFLDAIKKGNMLYLKLDKVFEWNGYLDKERGILDTSDDNIFNFRSYEYKFDLTGSAKALDF